MLKRLLITIACLLLISIGYFIYITWEREQELSAWSFIPDNSALVYESNNIYTVYEHFQKQNTWQTLSLIPEFDRINNTIERLDSTLNQKNGFLKTLNQNPVLISLHKTGRNQFDFMVTASLNQLEGRNMLSKIQRAFIDAGCQKRRRDFIGQDIIEIIENGKTIYAYTLYKQFFIGSTTSYLVEDAVRLRKDRLNADFLSTNDELSNLVKLQQDQGDLYINLSTVPNLLKEVYPSSPIKTLGKSGFLDLKVMSSSIEMDGFFVSEENQWLTTIGKSGESSLELTEVMPLSASMIQHFSFETGSEWGQRITSHLELSEPEVIQTRSELISELDMDVTYTFQLLADEAAIILNQDASTSHQLLLLEVADLSLMHKFLEGVIERYIKKSKDTVLNETYKTYKIRALPTDDFAYALLGKIAGNFKNCFYTSYRNYLIISDHLPYLKQTIDDIENENTWRKSRRKSTFIESINQEAGYSVFIDLPASLRKLEDGLDSKWANLIRKNDYVLRSFENIAIQFTSVDEKYYTNVLINQPTGSILNEVVPVEVKSISLGNRITSKPQLLFIPQSQNYGVMVQDETNELYWLSEDFKVVWSRALGTQISSKIQTLDYYKNGNIQLVFSTADSLHIIDVKGRNVPGFPAKIRGADSLQFFSTVDYDGSKNYRFAAVDRRGAIYLTDKEAKPLEGWKPKKMESELAAPLSHYRISNRDLFLIPLKEGNIHMLNRRGIAYPGFPIMTNEFLSGDIFFSPASSFRTSSISTVTANGNLQTYDLQGNTITFDQLYKPEPNTSFQLLKDVSGSSFIIIRKSSNRIDFLNSNQKLLFGKDYLEEDQLFVQYYSINPSKQFIIIGNFNGKFIYIYDLSGRLITNRPLIGNQPISYIYQEKTNEEAIYLVNQSEVSLLRIER